MREKLFSQLQRCLLRSMLLNPVRGEEGGRRGEGVGGRRKQVSLNTRQSIIRTPPNRRGCLNTSGCITYTILHYYMYITCPHQVVYLHEYTTSHDHTRSTCTTHFAIISVLEADVVSSLEASLLHSSDKWLISCCLHPRREIRVQLMYILVCISSSSLHAFFIRIIRKGVIKDRVLRWK